MGIIQNICNLLINRHINRHILRGIAATHYYALSDPERADYATLCKSLTNALCPKIEREKHFSEFEQRKMRRGEDPAVFIFELRQLLLKADPTLSDDGKEALLSRQFMRGLPARIRLKLLENNGIPTLQGMVEFVQRHRAVEYELDAESSNSVQNDDPYRAEVASLVAAVKELPTEQKNLRSEIDHNRQ